MKNTKTILLWLIIVTHPFWLANTCGSGTPDPTPGPVETIQLDVPYHMQTLDYTCGAVCAWMYVEYLGNRIGFYNELPADPELTFHNFLEENGYNVWSVNGEYSFGLNIMLYYYTWTPDTDYTTTYYGPEDYFDYMLDKQKQAIDIGEPCIVGLEVDPEVYHGVVLIGYEKEIETGEIVTLIAHDPMTEEAKKYTIDEWKTYTNWHMRTRGWFFVAKEDLTTPTISLYFFKVKK